MTDKTRELFTYLEKYLQSRIPGSRLEKTRVPQVPELSLYLISEDYPRDGLSAAQVLSLMEDPPYWCFCWASGQILGRSLLDHPDLVKAKTLVDFGAGSGVVGIAAKMAGAKRVILCDLDESALQAGELNGRINGVSLDFSADIEDILKEDVGRWVITAADVFYDRENLPLLEKMLHRFDTVLVSDSRLKGQPLPGMYIVGGYESRTVPDLDESHEFGRVTLYRSRHRERPGRTGVSSPLSMLRLA